MKRFSYYVLGLILVCGGLMLAAACSSSEGGISAQETAPPVMTDAPTLASTTQPEALPTADVQAGMITAEGIAQRIVGAYLKQQALANRATSTITLGNGEVAHTTVAFMPPEAYHITGEGFEILVLDRVVWMLTEGTWQQLELDANTLVDYDVPAEIEATLREVEAVGEETLGGQDMEVYSFWATTRVNGQPTEQQFTVWIGKNDGRLYQQEITGQVMGLNPETGKSESVEAVTVMVFEYDAKIVIPEP